MLRSTKTIRFCRFSGFVLKKTKFEFSFVNLKTFCHKLYSRSVLMSAPQTGWEALVELLMFTNATVCLYLGEEL